MASIKVQMVCALTATALLAGCVGMPEDGPQVQEMTFWVEQIPWEIHPNVETTVWAFCAEGDGIEPVWEGPCGVPGSTVHVTAGDLIRLTFRNTHTIPHTIHFHGWHPYVADMNGNALLGEAMVVPPGDERTIEWIAEPAGTFIYHCHFETPSHMEMGMYGAFIVDDPADEQEPDQDIIAVLDEWQVRDEPMFDGNIPSYNFFTINGKSFPYTQAITADVGEHIRIHMVNAGYEFHAMHLHGYTPDSWEGVAGPEHSVPTDVREIAPGQSVVLDLHATREGVWLFHDHVVPRVTAASDGTGFGAYPRGMLTVLAVGQAAIDALPGVAAQLVAAAESDVAQPVEAPPSSAEDAPGSAGPADGAPAEQESVQVIMKDFVYKTQTLEVPAGTTVSWINQDSVYHTVTMDHGSVDSGRIESGETWSTTFDEPGTYTYHCSPHAYQDGDDWKGMVATVVVS